MKFSHVNSLVCRQGTRMVYCGDLSRYLIDRNLQIIHTKTRVNWKLTHGDPTILFLFLFLVKNDLCTSDH